jgi:hypothetical protein
MSDKISLKLLRVSDNTSMVVPEAYFMTVKNLLKFYGAASNKEVQKLIDYICVDDTRYQMKQSDYKTNIGYAYYSKDTSKSNHYHLAQSAAFIKEHKTAKTSAGPKSKGSHRRARSKSPGPRLLPKVGEEDKEVEEDKVGDKVEEEDEYYEKEDSSESEVETIQDAMQNAKESLKLVGSAVGHAMTHEQQKLIENLNETLAAVNSRLSKLEDSATENLGKAYLLIEQLRKQYDELRKEYQQVLGRHSGQIADNIYQRYIRGESGLTEYCYVPLCIFAKAFFTGLQGYSSIDRNGKKIEVRKKVNEYEEEEEYPVEVDSSIETIPFSGFMFPTQTSLWRLLFTLLMFIFLGVGTFKTIRPSNPFDENRDPNARVFEAGDDSSVLPELLQPVADIVLLPSVAVADAMGMGYSTVIIDDTTDVDEDRIVVELILHQLNGEPKKGEPLGKGLQGSDSFQSLYQLADKLVKESEKFANHKNKSEVVESVLDRAIYEYLNGRDGLMILKQFEYTTSKEVEVDFVKMKHNDNNADLLYGPKKQFLAKSKKEMEEVQAAMKRLFVRSGEKLEMMLENMGSSNTDTSDPSSTNLLNINLVQQGRISAEDLIPGSISERGVLLPMQLAASCVVAKLGEEGVQILRVFANDYMMALIEGTEMYGSVKDILGRYADQGFGIVLSNSDKILLKKAAQYIIEKTSNGEYRNWRTDRGMYMLSYIAILNGITITAIAARQMLHTTRGVLGNVAMKVSNRHGGWLTDKFKAIGFDDERPLGNYIKHALFDFVNIVPLGITYLLSSSVLVAVNDSPILNDKGSVFNSALLTSLLCSAAVVNIANVNNLRRVIGFKDNSPSDNWIALYSTINTAQVFCYSTGLSFYTIALSIGQLHNEKWDMDTFRNIKDIIANGNDGESDVVTTNLDAIAVSMFTLIAVSFARSMEYNHANKIAERSDRTKST